MDPSSHLWLLPSKQRLYDKNYKSQCVPDLNFVCFFCIQNSDFSTRIASLYWSQPSSVVFACKTATLWPELIVSMGTRPHLSFWACKITWLATEILVYMGHSPHLWFLKVKHRLLDQKNKSLWVPDFACWFVNAKQRAYIQNDACLLVLAFICGFAHSQHDFSIRITSLNGSQPSFVAFACKTATLGPELQVSMGPRPHLCFFLHSKPRI